MTKYKPIKMTPWRCQLSEVKTQAEEGGDENETAFGGSAINLDSSGHKNILLKSNNFEDINNESFNDLRKIGRYIHRNFNMTGVVS